MKPANFPEANVTFAKDQPEYLPLPAFRDPGPNGNVISCWELSFRERVRILFKGKIWMNLMMFGKPLTPSLLSTQKKDVLTTLKCKKKDICKCGRLHANCECE